ncbi:MAG: sugar transferase [Actinomycetia bacterium]|nr:sugar transferase [Actinomycetes bacterium]
MSEYSTREAVTKGAAPFVTPKHPGYLLVKRVGDFVCALLALVLLSWLLMLIALAVLLLEGRPVLFVQQRPGRGGRLFKLYKFRTMRPAPEGRSVAENAASDVARLTRFGRGLRATGLDELPELFNIARGDLSFVGPRPLLPEYLPLYTAEQVHRHDVRPGITGLAQVRGRNLLSWEERFAADLEYVREVSFGLDLRILAATVGLILRGRGAEAPDGPTSRPFTGSMTGMSEFTQQ